MGTGHVCSSVTDMVLRWHERQAVKDSPLALVTEAVNSTLQFPAGCQPGRVQIAGKKHLFPSSLVPEQGSILQRLGIYPTHGFMVPALPWDHGTDLFLVVEEEGKKAWVA